MLWILSVSSVTRQGTNSDKDNAQHERASNELAVEVAEDTWQKIEQNIYSHTFNEPLC